MAQKILIVDDDPHIRELVQFALEKAGFASFQAVNGVKALEVFNNTKIDLLVLDISMPEMDGFELCKNLRKISDVPILFLSAIDDEIEKIIGFEIGADDYVTKPFSPRELISRIKSILKRSQSKEISNVVKKNKIIHNNIIIDEENHHISYKDIKLDLTATEFAILKTLIASPKRVFNRDDLINFAYNNINVSDRTIDSHIRNIRKKLKDLGCNSAIDTLHGVGFRSGECN